MALVRSRRWSSEELAAELLADGLRPVEEKKRRLDEDLLPEPNAEPPEDAVPGEEPVEFLHPIEENKNFRFQGVKVFLTYPRCPIRPSEFLDALPSDLRPRVTKWIIASEPHRDGSMHLHVILCFDPKVDTKNPRFFDVQAGVTIFHPNIKSIKKNFNKVAAYVMKGGNYICNINLLGLEWTGYIRKKADFEAWARDLQQRQFREPRWPKILPTGERWDAPKMGKQRHLWLWGPPDCGKTSWVFREFTNEQIYMRAPTEHPYEQYNGEQVVICDDFHPSFQEIVGCTQVYPANIRMHVFGKVRYSSKFWPTNQSRVMIVLSNHSIEDVYAPKEGKPDHRAAIHARFLQMYVEDVFDYFPDEDDVDHGER